MKTISLRCFDGDRVDVEVIAEVGNFAVHETIDGDGLFIITHTPSGYAVPAGISDGRFWCWNSPEDALSFATRLNNLLWPHDIQPTPDGKWRASKHAANVYRALCKELWAGER